MSKIDWTEDKDGCCDIEVYQGVSIQSSRDADGNYECAVFEEVDGGVRKVVELPDDFRPARVEVLVENKAFFIEGEKGRKLTCLKGANQQYYAVGNGAKTDHRGRAVLSHRRMSGLSNFKSNSRAYSL